MKLLFSISIFLGLLLPATAVAIGFYMPGDTLHVLAASGLRLRQTPENGAVILTIPYGAKIIVDTNEAGKLEGEATIEGIKGRWERVWYMGKVGYVFNGFLSFLPAPTPECKSIEEYLAKMFRQVGPPLAHMQYMGDDYYTHDTLKTFLYSNRYGMIAVCREAGMYEGYESSTTFYDVSPEEIWLIARMCYQQDWQQTLERKDPSDKRDYRPLTTFVSNREAGAVFIDCSYGGYVEIQIRPISGGVVLEYESGI